MMRLSSDLRNAVLHSVILVLAGVAPLSGARAAIVISSDATTNMSCSGETCTATASNAVLNVRKVKNLLAQGATTVATGTATDDLVVAAAISWANGNSLTLYAQRNIAIDRPVSDAGTGPIRLIYDAAGAGGSLSFGDKGSISFLGLATRLTINDLDFTLVGDIKTLAAKVRGNPSGNYALANRFDATNDGTYAKPPIGPRFSGRFEGLGNAISNLHVESGGNAALFAEATAAAILTNIRVTTATIDGFTVVGGVAALNQGTMSGNSFSGKVTLTGSVGDCGFVGGLVGINDGTIGFSHTDGAVDSTAKGLNCVEAGGLVGLSGQNNDAFVDHSYSVSTVSAAHAFDTNAGGLVGFASSPGGTSTVAYSFAAGPVTVKGSSTGPTLVGGLVGENHAAVSRSWANGAATGHDGAYVGGLLGGNFGPVDSSDGYGPVSGGVNCWCGGALGANQGVVSNSASFGTVIGGAGSDIGGFVGVDATPGDMSWDGWDMTTSGITNPSQGAGNIKNDPGITGFN